jgi:hypothetical protein
MSDLDNGPVEPQNTYGEPVRPFHVQQFEQGAASAEENAYALQQTAYARKGGYPQAQGSAPQQQANRPPHAGSHAPQQGHSSRQSSLYGDGPPRTLPVRPMPPPKSPVAALVFGILSWCGFGWLAAIPAIVLGVKGRRAAREGRTPNGGMATAGIWLGATNMVIGTLIFVFFMSILIPVFLNQRKKGIDVTLKSDMTRMATLQYDYVTANPGKKGLDVPATSPGGTVMAGGVSFTSSAGNVISVVASPKGYCVAGYNPEASAAISPTASKIYLSRTQGFEPGIGTC